MLPVNRPAKEAKCEDLEQIAIDDDPEKFFQIGAQLPPQEKEELLAFLRRNIDVFAWNAYEAHRGGSRLYLPSSECQPDCPP